MSVAKSSRQNSPVRDQLRAFDIDALHEALDAERSARGLTWSELAAEINEPFRGMTETEEYTRDTTNMRMVMRRAISNSVSPPQHSPRQNAWSRPPEEASRS